MDPGVQGIAILDQGFAACEHGNSQNAEHVQHGIPDICCPALGERQWFVIVIADFIVHVGAR
jgi:hypothetical protein